MLFNKSVGLLMLLLLIHLQLISNKRGNNFLIHTLCTITEMYAVHAFRNSKMHRLYKKVLVFQIQIFIEIYL